ncbi:MAG: rod shape-determining protein MreD [Ardenticatenaceae bacterium]|nr:rod shape-determining protein MreD [Ardenticatenaceae bacterium]HBY98994.1 rod shape-determining protein MreD [Chloroflexota bacterium]
MNLYLPAAVLTAAALIQITLLPHTAVAGVHPDLVLLLAVAWSLLRGSTEGVVWGFFGGVLLDLFSAAPFGVFTLALMVTCFMSGLGESAVFRQNILLPLGATLGATLLFHVAALVLLRTLGWPVNWSRDLLRVIVPATLLNTALMPLVYAGARRLSRGSAHMG